MGVSHISTVPSDMSFRGPLGPWESPGAIYRTLAHFDEWYQEIATSHSLWNDCPRQSYISKSLRYAPRNDILSEGMRI